ncbi:MAG: hypothetical protein ACSHX8_14135 [Opitutaceae bacterium]
MKARITSRGGGEVNRNDTYRLIVAITAYVMLVATAVSAVSVVGGTSQSDVATLNVDMAVCSHGSLCGVGGGGHVTE